MISEKQLMKRELERIGKMKMRNTKGMIRGWLTVVCVMMMMWVYSMNVLATAETGSTIYVNSDGTNVREGADTESASIGKANAGDAFSVVGQETDGSGAVWYNVSGTINGESKTGYIRSDLVSTSAPAEAPAEEMMLTEENAEAVTEPDAAEEVPEAQAPVENGESATVTTATSVGTLTPVEPEGTPEALPSGFRSVSINVNDVQVPAWTNDEFYIFYAAAPSGNIDWYVYDSVDGGYVRYTGFLLGSTISDSSVSENGKGAVSLPIVIVMSIVIVILVVVTLVMGIKLMNAGGDEEDDEDDYEDDEEEEDDYEEKPKKKSIFHKVSQAFADDEDDDEYDDEDDEYEDDEYEDDEEDDYEEEPVRKPAPRPQARPAARPQGQGQPRPATRPQGQGQPRPATRPQGQGQPRPATRPQGQGQPRPATRPQGQGQPRPVRRPQPTDYDED